MIAELAALALVTTPATCFDWIVVAHLKSQTYIGPLPVGQGELTLDSAYSWDAEIDRVLIGRGAPGRVELTVVAHTELLPQYARRVIMILGRDASGHVKLLHRQHLNGFQTALAATSTARQFARDSDIAQCETDR